MYAQRAGLWKFSYRVGDVETDLGTFAGNIDELAFRLADLVPDGVVLDIEAIDKSCTTNSSKRKITVHLKNPEVFSRNNILSGTIDDARQLISGMMASARDTWAGFANDESSNVTIYRGEDALRDAQLVSAAEKLSREEFDAFYRTMIQRGTVRFKPDHKHPWSWGIPE